MTMVYVSVVCVKIHDCLAEQARAECELAEGSVALHVSVESGALVGLTRGSIAARWGKVASDSGLRADRISRSEYEE